MLLFLFCFWRMGHGREVRTLGIIAGGGVVSRLWGPRSKLPSSIWSNSLITGIYSAVNARRHVLMFPPYKNNIYTPVPGVSSPVNRSCSESARCCVGCVVPYGLCQSVVLLFCFVLFCFCFYGRSWSRGKDTSHNSWWWSCPETLGSAFETAIQLMKQFTDNWYLPCCQCTETCSHVSTIQK